MMKRLAVLFIVLLLLPEAALPTENKNGVVGIISSSLANVRREPIPKSEIITQVLMADEVHIREKRDFRYRISIPSQGGIEGWIHQEAVLVSKDRVNSYLNADNQRIVITSPKTPSLILDKTGDHKVSLYAGTRLPVIENVNDGYKVLFPDRSVAIINSADAQPFKTIDPEFSELQPAEIAKTARGFLGVRHLSGGITSQGMDTRGLIYIVYRIHGITVERGRSMPDEKAEKIQKKDLLPGDILMFYGEGEGLYTGNGRFLHSIRKQSVQLGGIFDRRYSHSFKYGLRILNADKARYNIPSEMTADEIYAAQIRVAGLPVGQRVAYWAGRFIGTPYDPDPLGLYVRSNRIIADEKADCMYHVFRSVELATSGTPGDAIEKALAMRFITAGRIAGGIVQNYDDRFQYGEDMVFSGKWGRNITAELGKIQKIIGSRGRDEVEILSKNVLMTVAVRRGLQDGDIVFWVKDPKKRVVEEIVGHLSVVRVKAGRPYVIHAAGNKDRQGKPGGGVVKEVPFYDYVRDMRFIGAFVTRFEQ